MQSTEPITQLIKSTFGGNAFEKIVTPLAGLIFLRWADQFETELEAIAAFDEADFEPTLPQGLRWRSWCELQGNRLRAFLSERLIPALGGGLPGTFGYRVEKVKPALEHLAGQPEEVQNTLMEWVRQLKLETAEDRRAAGLAFDDILDVGLSRPKDLPHLSTPQVLAELMVELAEPKPGDRIYDPCFGLGNLLVQAARRLHGRGVQGAPRAWKEIRDNSIYGVENNPSAYVVAMTRLVLAGIENPGLQVGDALTRPTGQNRAAEGFDCVLANPPMGTQLNLQGANHFPINARWSESLFLQHVMGALRPGGRAVIVLPERTLFSTGPERRIREMLLKEYRVEGVIALDERAFPHSRLKQNLLVFRKELPADKVRFYTVGRLAPASGTVRQLSLFDAAEPSALYQVRHRRGETNREGRALHDRPLSPAEAVHEFRQGAAGEHLWDTSVKDLSRRDWELVVKHSGQEQLNRLLRTISEADPDTPIRRLRHIAEVFPGISYVRENVTDDPGDSEAYYGLLRVSDIDRGIVQHPTLFVSKESSDSRAVGKRLLASDVVLSSSGTIGKVGVVANGGVGAIPSNSLIVVRPKEGMSPHYLAALLQSANIQQWLKGHARGDKIQRLSVRTLRELTIPAPPLQLQTRLLNAQEKDRSDVLDLLSALLREGGRDPALDAIQSILERVRYERTASLEGGRGTGVSLLGRFAETVIEEYKMHPSIPLRLVQWETPHDFPDRREMQSSPKSLSFESDVMHCISSESISQHRVAESRPAREEPRQLSAFLQAIVTAMLPLRGIAQSPKGMGRLVALQQARFRMEEARAQASGSAGPADETARQLIAILEEMVGFEIESLLGDVQLVPSMDPPWLVAGKNGEVHLKLENKSPVALNQVRFTTQPDVGQSRAVYLADGQSLEHTLTIPAQIHSGRFDFTVTWEALRLDGQPIAETIPLSIEIRATRDAVHTSDLGSSPYIVGNPVDRPEMFFGRQDIVDQIRRQLSGQHTANVILLEGNRRTGKTSILKFLETSDLLPGWIVANCSFQGGEGHDRKVGLPTHEVFRLMAKQIGYALHAAGQPMTLPDWPKIDPRRPFKTQFVTVLRKVFSSDHPFETFELYLENILNAIKPRRLLLMLDEFDKLQEGIDAGITSPQVPENIRYLLHTYSGFSAILTGSRRLKRLREEYWSALFGFGYRIGVTPLAVKDARKLVTEPVAGRLVFVPQARDQIVELCARQPFLIQSLCNRIFEYAVRTGERTVTHAMVSAAAEEMIEDNEHFRTLWGYAGSERRRLLLAICEHWRDDLEPVTLGLLESEFSKEPRIPIPRNERLGSDLEFLRELELLKFDAGSQVAEYRLAIPLMGRWIRRHIDFEDLRHLAIREGEEKI